MFGMRGVEGLSLLWRMFLQSNSDVEESVELSPCCRSCGSLTPAHPAGPAHSPASTAPPWILPGLPDQPQQRQNLLQSPPIAAQPCPCTGSKSRERGAPQVLVPPWMSSKRQRKCESRSRVGEEKMSIQHKWLWKQNYLPGLGKPLVFPTANKGKCFPLQLHPAWDGQQHLQPPWLQSRDVQTWLGCCSVSATAGAQTRFSSISDFSASSCTPCLCVFAFSTGEGAKLDPGSAEGTIHQPLTPGTAQLSPAEPFWVAPGSASLPGRDNVCHGPALGRVSGDQGSACCCHSCPVAAVGTTLGTEGPCLLEWHLNTGKQHLLLP